MGNRRRPRNIHLSEPHVVNDLDATVDAFLAGPCPDCNADLVVERQAPNLARLEVQHDATCPWFRRWSA